MKKSAISYDTRPEEIFENPRTNVAREIDQTRIMNAFNVDKKQNSIILFYGNYRIAHKFIYFLFIFCYFYYLYYHCLYLFYI